jgi:spermidine/putrescine-binding protein
MDDKFKEVPKIDTSWSDLPQEEKDRQEREAFAKANEPRIGMDAEKEFKDPLAFLHKDEHRDLNPEPKLDLPNFNEPDRHKVVTLLDDCEGKSRDAETKPAPKRAVPSDALLVKMIAAQNGRPLSEIPVMGKGIDDPFWAARNEYQMALNLEKK